MRKNVLLRSLFSFSILLGACSDGSDSRRGDPLPDYNFSAVDARLQEFLDESEAFEGISITLVDTVQGTVHEASFGDHTPDIVVALAAVAMPATTSLLMAIDEDELVDFDIDTPIATYLPWVGVYGEPTSAQMLNHTSGIPGVFYQLVVGDYGEHGCQYDPNYDFDECAKRVYSSELPGSKPPGVAFDYGGSQWYLAGTVIQQATNSELNQLFDKYIAEPCGLEVFKYGNTGYQFIYGYFDGDPDNLPGTGNPHAGGGAISNMQDMAKLLLLHMREGMCGDSRVLSRDAVMRMQTDESGGLAGQVYPGRSYGMGWWWREEQLPGVLYANGTYGSVAWIDTVRQVGGFVAVDNYEETATSGPIGGEVWNLVLDEIIPLVGESVDDAYQEASQ